MPASTRWSNATARSAPNSTLIPTPSSARAWKRCARSPTIRARTTRDLSWQADVLAQGELLSSTLGAAYLRSQGLDFGWSDAREWLDAVSLPNASPWAQRLSVNCRCAPDAALQARFDAQPAPMLVTQGFIARHADGGTAILGRGGSDTSAAYFGALLGALRVEIWTDVPGMFSANPRDVPDARLLTRLDYAEAQEIATTGAKVLHPRSIAPCRDGGVPITILDTERPDLPGTRIDASAATVPGVKAISRRNGIVLVSMESIGMWQQVGFLADVFERFKRNGLSVDLIGSSETNVTVSLDPSENLVTTNVLETLSADLAEVCRVKVIAPCAAITLVGRGMRSLLHKLSDVWATFGKERVHLISQSSNDLNLTFVVDEADADGMLPQLHAELIRGGAMPVQDTTVFGPSWRDIAHGKPVRRVPWWVGKREPLLAIAANATPTYAYDLATVRNRARDLAAIDAIDRRFFAIKANPHPAILRTLVEEGFGLECVSIGELEHVFRHVPSLSPERVVFTPSFAPRKEYEAAFAMGVTVTLDNVEALHRWPEVFRGRTIWLRLDIGHGGGHHAKVNTGGVAAKFGLSLQRFDEFVEQAHKLGVRISGLHAHMGSGIDDPRHWRLVYAELAGMADSVGTIESIDIGGGLPVAVHAGCRRLRPRRVARGAGGDPRRVSALPAGGRTGPLHRRRMRRAVAARHAGRRKGRRAPRGLRRRHERARAPGDVRGLPRHPQSLAPVRRRYAGIRRRRPHLRKRRRAGPFPACCPRRRPKAT